MRAWITMLVLTASARAHADPATADRLATEAEAAAKAGDFVGAAAKYRAAHAADARTELLCNVGVAYFKAKTEAARAHLFLGRCVEMGARLDPQFVDTARDVLKAVEATLRAGDFAPVELRVKPTGTLVAVGSWSPDETFLARSIWLPLGTHQLTFTADGYAPKSVTVELPTKDPKTVDVELVRPPDTIVQQPNLQQPPPPRPRRTSAEQPSLLPAVAVTAATLGMIVASVWSRSVAHDYAADAGGAIRPIVYEDDKSTMQTYNLVMIATGSLAVAGATIGGYLWYRALRTPSTQVEIEARAGTFSLGIRGSF